MIMMCECRFTSCYKCTSLVGDVDNEEYCLMGVGNTKEISIPSAQLTDMNCSKNKVN